MRGQKHALKRHCTVLSCDCIPVNLGQERTHHARQQALHQEVERRSRQLVRQELVVHPGLLDGPAGAAGQQDVLLPKQGACLPANTWAERE